MTRQIRIGTRGSPLARWQAGWVAERLRALDPGVPVELVEIKTQGDRDRAAPLAAFGGVGLFTREIQRALQDAWVDVAVHSLKDLPTQRPPELILAAVTAREDVADALIAPIHRTLDALPLAARVGTGSPRRRAQLRFLRPDLEIVPLRGNVETRLTHIRRAQLDAVVLAWAGLRRLGLQGHVTQRLGPPEFLPAVGQGALGVECRCDDTAVLALLQPLDDADAHRAIRVERTALAELGGGCTLPIAAWARDVDSDETDHASPALALDAAVFDLDGRDRVNVTLYGPRDDPDALGRRAASVLRNHGAIRLLERARSSDNSRARLPHSSRSD
jgi:hydroxymethylbilane synthase